MRNLKDENGERLVPNWKINSIVNRTLISSQTNRRISRRDPSDYIEKLVPPERKEEIMASHYIDADALSAMEADQYETFLDARELTLMMEIIKRLS